LIDSYAVNSLKNTSPDDDNDDDDLHLRIMIRLYVYLHYYLFDWLIDIQLILYINVQWWPYRWRKWCSARRPTPLGPGGGSPASAEKSFKI